MTSTLVCLFALLAVGTIFSLPLEPDFTSTAFPVEGHLLRAFTDDFGLFDSTLNTPSLAEREVLPEENTEMTSTDVEQTKRGLEETESTDVEGTSTEGSMHDERVLRIKERSQKIDYKPVNVASRAHDEDDEEEEEHTSKKTVEAEKEDSSVESDEATTLAGRLAEFDPTVFDSVSTPAGTHLQFDENQQSIDRPSTEASEQTTEKAIEEEKKEKRLTLVQLNQGQNSSLIEEKKSNH